MNLTPLEADNRVRLPADWIRDLGLRDLVSLERTGDGILIRPSQRYSWDDIFATKLVINSAPPDQKDDDGEAAGDDFLY